MTPRVAATLYLTHVLDGKVPTRAELDDLIEATRTLKAVGISGPDLINRQRLEAVREAL